MLLKILDIDELLNGDVFRENVFVQIPFLYSPVMVELKRIEKEIKSLYFRINEVKLDRTSLILSLLRLFSYPESISETENSCEMTYDDKIIVIEYLKDGLMFYGKCIFGKSNLIFSEDIPFIRVENTGADDSVIVLPEGDGQYYMELDRSESELGDRQSIIGDPVKLRELYLWLRDQTHG